MPSTAFPSDFLWGVATAGHQNEGDNVHSDTWFLENVSPTVFQDRSGRATNPLWYRAETNPRRWLYVAIAQANQVRKYRTHYERPVQQEHQVQA